MPTTFVADYVTATPQGTAPWFVSDWAAVMADLDTIFASLTALGVTSATTFTVGTGLKTFTISSGQSTAGISVGQLLTVYEASAPGNMMTGDVTATTSSTISINVQFTAGSGSHSDWVIVPAAVFLAPVARVVAKTGSYAVVSTDISNTIFQYTGAGGYTHTLYSATSAGAGYLQTIKNDTSAGVTISGATVDGVSSITLATGAAVQLAVNAASTAYMIVGAKGYPGSGLPVSTRTSNTILSVGDNSTHVVMTVAYASQTFAITTTLGNGWECEFENATTSNVLLVPNAADTMDGLSAGSSIPSLPGEVRRILSNGAGALSTILLRDPSLYVLSSTGTFPWVSSIVGASVTIVGAAGGGGAGQPGNSSGATGGGGGGGPGNVIEFFIPAAQYTAGAGVPCTVGAGGAGGHQGTVAVSGGITTLGFVSAAGGNIGTSTSTGGLGGSFGDYSQGASFGGGGGNGGDAARGGSNPHLPGGGGGGGGQNSIGGYYLPNSGGRNNATAGGVSGGSPGASGTSGSTAIPGIIGPGGGGGYGNTGGLAGNGGAGGFPGGGGGGGGASFSTGTTFNGSGGTGGNGAIYVQFIS